MEMIAHGAGLPELGIQKINIYGAKTPKNELVGKLSEMLRQGFCLTRPVAVSQS